VLIVACIKQVPDTAYIKIDPATGTLIREGVPSNLNPFDTHALEESLKLKNKYGFQVVAISMGPPNTEATLKNAVALGADEVILLSDPVFSGADTLATSIVLAETIKRLAQREEVGMVICGKQTTDGATAQVGPGIATRLKYSQLTLVDQIQNVDEQARKVTVRRMLEGRYEIVEATLPSMITVVPQINQPREPTVPMQMMAEDAEVTLWDNKVMQLPEESIGLKGSPTQVRKIFSQIMPESEILGDGISDPEGAACLLVDTLIEEDILSL